MESPQTSGTIRRCVFRDLDRVIPIYNFYVSNTVASLDIEPKPLLYMQRLFNSVADQNLPFLVVTAKNDHNAPRNQEKILGYAYAHFYRRLPAFGGTVEILVYLDHTATGQGIGEKLVNVLLAVLRDLGPGTDRDHGIREVLAIVPVDEGRDASGFFLRQRFEDRGVLRGVAWKMGRSEAGRGEETIPKTMVEKYAPQKLRLTLQIQKYKHHEHGGSGPVENKKGRRPCNNVFPFERRADGRGLFKCFANRDQSHHNNSRTLKKKGGWKMTEAYLPQAHHVIGPRKNPKNTVRFERWSG